MDAKQAAIIAKQHALDLFGPEGAFNVGLEELRFDETSAEWEVVVSFSRDWDRLKGPLSAWSEGAARRRFKKFHLSDNDGSVRAIEDQPLAA